MSVWWRLARAVVARQMPNYVIAFVTGRCDMNCGRCCDAARRSRGSDELTPAQWADAVAGASALLHLSITGGEPFLRDDLVECVAGMVRASGVPRVSINTNGFRSAAIASATGALLEALPRTDLAVAVSIDGPAAVHDELRRRPGAAAAARETIDRLAPLRQDHPRFTVRIQSLLQPGNADALEGFLAETAAWPVDFHEVILLRDVDAATQGSLLPAYERLTALQLERAAARYAGGVEWRLFRSLRREVIARVRSKDGGGPCLAGGRMLEVLPDGSVVGCEVGRMLDTAAIGEVGRSGARLVDVARSPRARAFRRDVARRGRCTFECAITTNRVFRVRRWPGLM